MNGWRFADVKDRIDALERTVVGSAAQLSSFLYLMHHHDANSPRNPIAVITCLPPDDTGIATFAWKTFVEDGAYDIVSSFRDPLAFLKLDQLRRRGTSAGNPIPAAMFQTVTATHRYEAIVAELGNSDHNLFVVDALKAMQETARASVWVHLHDPCLFNVLEKTLYNGRREFDRAVVAAYPDLLSPPPARVPETQPWLADRHYFERGVTGGRLLRRRLGIRRFLVNSEAARTMLAHDLGADAAASEIRVLFHPVFRFLADAEDPSPIAPRIAGEVLIGTFGVPGEPKMTECVLDAAALLATSRSVRVVLAGYGCQHYWTVFGGSYPGLAVEVLDAPDDRTFARAMAEVDIAVQLRRRNTGESSGVVPMLLGMGKRVITSPVGAFRDFGPAVAFTGEACNATALASAIGAALDAPPPASHIDRYVRGKGVAEFRRLLEAAVLRRRIEPAGADEPSRPEKSSRAEKPLRAEYDAVLRLLRGERAEMLSREFGVADDTLAMWRDAFLAAGAAGLSLALAPAGHDEPSETREPLKAGTPEHV